MKYDHYLSDAGGNNMIRTKGSHIFDNLQKAKLGELVQVLIHADWWF